jgi:hypothetical protein
MPQAGCLFVSLLLLATAQLVGGPAWAALCAIALAAQIFAVRRTSSLTLIACSLSWMILSRLTGNRQLFFPYTMSLATVVFFQLCDQNVWRGVFGAITMLAAFFVVRIQQHASAHVLFIEFLAAASILAFAMIAHGLSRQNLGSRIVITSLVALLAFLSLVV